jgi:transcription elongation factor GreA
MNKVPMTVQGERALREELEQLKKVDRPRISQAIAEAREHGDLKENAEYHAAREQQSFAEGRIMDIEGKLSHAQVIDVSGDSAYRQGDLRRHRDLINVETDETVTYRIVGDDEADAKQNLISVNSPIARALIGKEEGDAVSGARPRRRYRVRDRRRWGWRPPTTSIPATSSGVAAGPSCHRTRRCRTAITCCCTSRRRRASAGARVLSGGGAGRLASRRSRSVAPWPCSG